MTMYEQIKTGLQEAIAVEQGTLRAKTRRVTIAPLPSLAPDEIKSIRHGMSLTQASFAALLGVSTKTVEAWEAGRNHPDGASVRLLSFAKTQPHLFDTLLST